MTDYGREGSLGNSVLNTNFTRATQRAMNFIWEFTSPIFVAKYNLERLINSLGEPVDARLTGALASLRIAEGLLDQQKAIGALSTPPHAGTSSQWSTLAAQIACSLMTAKMNFKEWNEENYPAS